MGKKRLKYSAIFLNLWCIGTHERERSLSDLERGLLSNL